MKMTSWKKTKSLGQLYLKGLDIIFAGQENTFIIFRSKEIYIYFKTNKKIPHKFAEIMKKTGFWVIFILEGTLTVFLIF